MASPHNESWYSEGFAELNRRNNEREMIAEALSHIATESGLDKCQSLLSIGPGSGYLDVQLIRNSMPHLEQYYAVEPRNEALKELGDSMEKDIGRKIKVDLFEGGIEEWCGPADSVKLDAVLMVHVLYHIPAPQALFRRCMEWLRPGGVIIIANATADCLLSKIAEVIPSYDAGYNATHIVADLKAIGIKNWTEKTVPLNFDLRNVSQALINFILEKDATEEETKAIRELFSTVAPSGIYEDSMSLLIV